MWVELKGKSLIMSCKRKGSRGAAKVGWLPGQCNGTCFQSSQPAKPYVRHTHKRKLNGDRRKSFWQTYRAAHIVLIKTNPIIYVVHLRYTAAGSFEEQSKAQQTLWGETELNYRFLRINFLSCHCQPPP